MRSLENINERITTFDGGIDGNVGRIYGIKYAEKNPSAGSVSVRAMWC